MCFEERVRRQVGTLIEGRGGGALILEVFRLLVAHNWLTGYSPTQRVR